MNIKKIALVALVLLMAVSMMACGARKRFDPETFKTAAEKASFTVEEVDPATLGQQGIQSFSTGEKEGANVQVLVLDSAAAARTMYASMAASVAAEGSVTEKQIDSTTYNKLYVKSGTTFTGVVRVENTLFFGQSTNPDDVRTLIAALE